VGKRDARVVGGGNTGALEMSQGFNEGVREPRKHKGFLLVLVLGGNSNNSVFPVGSNVRVFATGRGRVFGRATTNPMFSLGFLRLCEGQREAVLERGFCECLSFLKKTLQQQWTVH